MKGETVEVLRPVAKGTDDLNNPIDDCESETVENVLVCPKETDDVVDGIRRDGMTLTMTLHFPKTYSKALEGCKVVCRGITFDVLGNPQPYTLDNCPTDWWMPVEVGAFDG